MTVELSDLLARWHPQGLARLAGAGTQRLVTVRGPAGAGASVLSAELDEADGIDCTEAAADVVVCVVDAAAPITDDELADLKALAAGGQSIVVAVNKIDVHPEWKASLAATAARVARIDPQLPVVGVSALLAQLARRTQSDLPSGLGHVVTEISTTASLAGDRVLPVVVAEAIANVERELGRAQETESVLRARRIDLAGQRDGGRAATLAAAKAKIQLTRVGLLHDVNDAIRAAGQRLRRRIDRASAAELRAGGQLASECAAELLVEVHRRAHDRLAPFGARDLDLSSVRMPEPPHSRSRGAEDGLMVVLGASAGFGIGRLAVAPLSLVPAADIASMPVALGLGGAVAWWFVRMRSLGADRVHVRAWASDALASMKSQLEQIVHARLVELETTLAGEAMASSTRQAVAVDQELALVEAELRRQLPLLSERRSQLTRDLEALRRAGSGSCMLEES
jgi:hypothetical protein